MRRIVHSALSAATQTCRSTAISPCSITKKNAAIRNFVSTPTARQQSKQGAAAKPPKMKCEVLQDGFYRFITRGLDLNVCDLGFKGRGLVASRDFESGEVIFTEIPFVAGCQNCLEGNMSCGLCSAPITVGDGVLRNENEIENKNFLFTKRNVAAVGDEAKETIEGTEPVTTLETYMGGVNRRTSLEKRCYQNDIQKRQLLEQQQKDEQPTDQLLFQMQQIEGIRFPVMTKKIIAKVLHDLATNGNMYSTWIMLNYLAYPNVRGLPPAWEVEHQLLSDDLWQGEEKRHNSNFFDLGFYARSIGLLHLNAFILDAEEGLKLDKVISVDDNNSNNTKVQYFIDDSQSKTVTREVTTLYTLASFLNHSCTPNTMPICDNADFRTYFVAKRDIKKGEEITVAYYDTSRPKEERREHLEYAYGFKCFDQKCEDCKREFNL